MLWVKYKKGLLPVSYAGQELFYLIERAVQKSD